MVKKALTLRVSTTSERTPGDKTLLRMVAVLTLSLKEDGH